MGTMRPVEYPGLRVGGAHCLHCQFADILYWGKQASPLSVDRGDADLVAPGFHPLTCTVTVSLFLPLTH